jgi:hypothetical protein
VVRLSAPASTSAVWQIAAHLRACGSCEEDLEGLLAALRGEAR